MKTLNTAGQALYDRLLAGEQIPLVPLVFFDLTVPQRWAVCGVPLVWDGNTYAARDIGVERIEHDTQSMPGLRFMLPGASESELALAFDDVEGSAVELYAALVDPDTGVVADVIDLWAGSLDVPGWEDGPTATVIFSAEHRGTTALRQRVSRYTNDEQLRLYSGDTSLDVDPGTDKAPVVWPNASYFRV